MTTNDLNHSPYLTILLMGAAIYSNRVIGYWLAGRIRINHQIETWLKYLPGCILISLVAPAIAKSGPVEMLASALTVLVMWRTHSVLLSMVVGMGFVSAMNFFVY